MQARRRTATLEGRSALLSLLFSLVKIENIPIPSTAEIATGRPLAGLYAWPRWWDEVSPL